MTVDPKHQGPAAPAAATTAHAPELVSHAGISVIDLPGGVIVPPGRPVLRVDDLLSLRLELVGLRIRRRSTSRTRASTPASPWPCPTWPSASSACRT